MMIEECPFCGSIRIVETLKGGTSICLACESFFNTIDGKSKPTLFNRITASPEVLAEKLVYIIRFEEEPSLAVWASSIIQSVVFFTKAEAIAATVEKLKEVCDE